MNTENHLRMAFLRRAKVETLWNDLDPLVQKLVDQAIDEQAEVTFFTVDDIRDMAERMGTVPGPHGDIIDCLDGLANFVQSRASY